MCGIVGIYVNGKLKKEHIDYFTEILRNCEVRGSHATGVFNSKMKYLKSPVPSRSFTETSSYKKFIEKSVGAKYIIGHCRLATRGDPKINDNNHPLFDTKKRFFLVHNGMVDSNTWDFTPERTDTTIMVNATSHYLGKKKKLSEAVNDAQNDLENSGSNFSMFVIGDKNELVFSKSKSGSFGLDIIELDDHRGYAFASASYILGSERVKGKEVCSMYPARTSFFNLKTNKVSSFSFLKTVLPGAVP